MKQQKLKWSEEKLENNNNKKKLQFQKFKNFMERQIIYIQQRNFRYLYYAYISTEWGNQKSIELYHILDIT